jgi:hypothetical protein
LRKDFGLNAIIPHCDQFNKSSSDSHDDDDDENEEEDDEGGAINKNSKKRPKNAGFTSLQSSEARICTKVRSMVERMFAVIKSNKSLDYVRNTVLGHLGIDLRNACAIHNFTFRPTFYDKPNSKEVARRLKQRLDQYRNNNLEFILKRRLTTTNIFTRLKLDEVGGLGFIQLKGKYLREKIFCGGFQYKMARRSYITDLIKRSKMYLLTPNKKFQKEFDPNTKVIAVKMPSRFKRGINKQKANENEKVDQMTTTRRVYVQFTPHEPEKHPNKRRKCDFINGWICTCKNGKRLAGCCSHVACVIYFLSCARFKTQIKFPGEYLNRILKRKYKNKPT